MSFETGLKPGEVINNDRLCTIFQCSTQGGMRRSNSTNTLVLVSNHVKSIYDDRWIGNVFHYTGMGTEGDQSLDFMQNKTLAQSDSNGVSVHLFEVDREQEYRYQGSVALSGKPYSESQPDVSGNDRLVWVFPLRLLQGQQTPQPLEEFAQAQRQRERKARKIDPYELERRARAARPIAGQRAVISTQHERDPNVSTYAKLRAGGLCQLCDQPAPFKNSLGEPYLETHHLEWLAHGGKDNVENTVAHCPNCHRKMHVVNDARDIAKLKSKVADRT